MVVRDVVADYGRRNQDSEKNIGDGRMEQNPYSKLCLFLLVLNILKIVSLRYTSIKKTVFLR